DRRDRPRAFRAGRERALERQSGRQRRERVLGLRRHALRRPWLLVLRAAGDAGRRLRGLFHPARPLGGHLGRRPALLPRRAAARLGLPATTKCQTETLRMIVHTRLGGHSVRVRLTNGCGSTPLEIGAATIGLRDTGARIRAGTDRTLAFGGQPSVTIPPGSTA